MECARCRKGKTRHKCGAIAESKLAWRNYPVEDCAACNPVRPQGEFPEPPRDVPPVRAPTNVHIGEPPPKEKPPKEGPTRWEMARAKARRLRMLTTLVALGADTIGALVRGIERMGVDKPRRTLSQDLDELVKDRWLVRTRKARGGKVPKWQRDWQWSYSINPAIVAATRSEDDEE